MIFSRLLWFLVPQLALYDADPAPPNPGNPNPQNPDPNANGGGEGDKKTFTQAELNALFADRANQASTAAINKLLKDLGVESADAIKTALAEAKKVQDAQLSELDKAKADATKAAKDKETAEAAAAQATQLANTRLMQSAVMLEAAKTEHKFKPEALGDVWAFVDRSKLKVEENGDVTGVADAVKAVAKAKPYMVTEDKPAPGTPGPRRGQPPAATPPAGTPPATPVQPVRPLIRF